MSGFETSGNKAGDASLLQECNISDFCVSLHFTRHGLDIRDKQDKFKNFFLVCTTYILDNLIHFLCVDLSQCRLVFLTCHD